MDRLQWLQDRRSGIGGSDASILLGINKWRSPFDLWLDKTGKTEIEEKTNDFLHFGNVLEDVVAKEFESRTGKKVRRKNEMIRHNEHDFLFANVDRVVAGEKAILECKTTSAYNAKYWEGDEIPPEYLVQVQHYMSVMGNEYKKAYIACLIGGNTFVWKEVQRDDELIEYINQECVKFWQNHVIPDEAPAIDGLKTTTDFINAKFRNSEPGSKIDFGDRFANDLKRLEELKAHKKNVEEDIAAIENAIKNEMKEAEAASIEGYLVAWKNVKSNRIDSTRLKKELPDIYAQFCKESQSRRFTISAKKE